MSARKKLKILAENKGKSGIYMFNNFINGKYYIGSSDNLAIRFSAAPAYFNVNYLIRNKNMAICCALLKYGYSNFTIRIISYCEPEKCLEREKF